MRLALFIMIYHSLSGIFPLENYEALADRKERLRKMVPRSHFGGETYLLSPRCAGAHPPPPTHQNPFIPAMCYQLLTSLCEAESSHTGIGSSGKFIKATRPRQLLAPVEYRG